MNVKLSASDTFKEILGVFSRLKKTFACEPRVGLTKT